VIATIALAIGCSNSIGCDVCRTTAVANVFASDTTSQPLAGVDLQIEAYSDTCGSKFLGGVATLRADSMGFRRMLMSSLYSPHTANCLRVIISPGTNVAQPTDTVDFMTAIDFRVEDNSPRDSVRLDVIVR
jgi:hypothetical protein